MKSSEIFREEKVGRRDGFKSLNSMLDSIGWS